MTPKSSENDLGKLKDDDYETKSGTENTEAPSGDDQDPNQCPKRKRYHRHTQRQIQEMEAFFKECPHPDDKQRKELSRELGLEPLQVKFWFQNKRTQMKAHHERTENAILKAENEKLRAENSRYKEALSNASCPNCGGPAALGEMSFDEQHLRIENARLREEIDRISGIAAKYLGKPLSSLSHLSSHLHSRSHDVGVSSFGAQSDYVGGMYGATDLLRPITTGPTGAEKPMIVELAVAAMEELMRMALAGEPLWVPGENATEVLNEEEYLRAFPRGIGPRPLGLRSEASRESAVVIMNHANLVEILMDVNQWSTAFCGIVSRAMTLEILSTGVAGNYNGALQVMTAEFQVPSPLVPTREIYFVRYCKQHVDGTWAVVDVRWTIYALFQYQGVEEGPQVVSFKNCQTDTQSTRLDNIISNWSDDIRVMTRKSMDDPGRPPGIVLSAATSFWIPVPPKRVFEFLSDENHRREWDILSNGGQVEEMAHIANGRDPGNSVSLLRVNVSCSKIVECKLKPKQHADIARELHRLYRVICFYAPVDISAMNIVLSGGDADYVALLPSGFAILPDGPAGFSPGGIVDVGSGGALLTVAFQILVDSVPTAKLSLGSVATVNNLIKCTVERIKTAVTSENNA
ncbi:hypothetical protein GH714_000929 [Hevea brasiliensis]|uniref:Uncharacterized protein n=1 Tax=Hevea brasiliensis TaxID=3981 RepID=A0A6A6LZ64_HEVBR|nr:hypothetical protein GH714_000929 [Hevea brasiliensis]